jgi:hypothetical protein
MIALLGTVLMQARTHLNDDEGVNWPDNKLIPKAQQAFNQMQAEFLLAGLPIVNEVSVIMTVPAMTTDDSSVTLNSVTGYPTDIIMPVWMKERQIGQKNVDFIDMLEVDFIPQIDIDTMLVYWCWIGQKILLRGCLNTTQVMLRYQCLLPMPGLNTDSTQVILGELYLSYKVAALAAFSARQMDLYQALNGTAEMNLDKLVRMNVRQQQDLPAKRRPYHRGGGNQVIRSL